MSTPQVFDKLEISLKMVSELIAEQFPQWSDLEINPVELNGIDNRTFRLGTEMSIRLPIAEEYALQVLKEQKWLPVLASHLSFPIPKPLALGNPSKHYPWQWSIYRWIEGVSANILVLEDVHLQLLALQLAQFVKELHKIPALNGPTPGPHNYWRGSHLSVYDTEIKSAIIKLEDIIDRRGIIAVWERAICSKWNHQPVWVHGDFSIGNFLMKDGHLAAIIDFGCMGVGDPACDLVIAWTLLKNESRKVFENQLSLDPETWIRAQGWALWKSSIELVTLKNKTSPEAIRHQNIINAILNENKPDGL